MNYYIETLTDKLVYCDVELDERTQNKIDKQAQDVAQLQNFLDNHPKWLQRKDPDPVKVARYNQLVADVASDVSLNHVVLRGIKANGTPNKIKLDTATYIGQWDGRSPFVETLYGTFPAGGISFMGWPQTDTQPDDPVPPTQAQIDAAIAAAAAKLAAQDLWRATAQAQMALGLPAYQAWIALNPYPA